MPSNEEDDDTITFNTFITRAEEDCLAGRPISSGNFWYIYRYLVMKYPKNYNNGETAVTLAIPESIPNPDAPWGSLTDR